MGVNLKERRGRKSEERNSVLETGVILKWNDRRARRICCATLNRGGGRIDQSREKVESGREGHERNGRRSG